MAGGKDKNNNDLYAVLGLNKECTPADLRNAYKKLALRWHPDRCSAPGNSMFVEEAKKKFQAIQEAYSVLSDADKRFLYDIGAYESDDDENGMGDFLNEMASMMSQTKTNENENAPESFEELQELFQEMFQEDIAFDTFEPSSQPTTSCSTSSMYATCGETSNPNNNKRNSSEINYGKTKGDDSSGFHAHFQSFCFGVEQQQDFKKGKEARGGIRGRAGGRKRQGRKQKVSSGHDVSSNNMGVSAS